ncbi:MAG: hypothetical protein AAFQ94_09730 [Bacteroidota bacterium]
MDKLSRWLHLLPALIASLIDIAITIIHQPKGYWEGNLNEANEGNPIGALFMENHISGLFVISGIEVLLIILLGYYLPTRISRYLLLFVLIAHSCAASTWISSRYGFWYTMSLALFNSLTYLIANDLIKKRSAMKS